MWGDVRNVKWPTTQQIFEAFKWQRVAEMGILQLKLILCKKGKILKISNIQGWDMEDGVVVLKAWI